jgi:hypothetical protein
MKSYDNHGKLASEINTSYTTDGKVITTNTLHNTSNGHPVAQSISIRDSQGKVTVENILGGKLLP